jgi:hypothetical protein
VDIYSSEGGGGSGTASRGRYTKQQQPVGSSNSTISSSSTISKQQLHSVHRNGTVSPSSCGAASTSAACVCVNPPTYSISGLHRDWVRPSSLLNNTSNSNTSHNSNGNGNSASSSTTTTSSSSGGGGARASRHSHALSVLEEKGSRGSGYKGGMPDSTHQSSQQRQHHLAQAQAQQQQRLGFWGQLQSEVLVLEEALQKGHLGGLALGRIDQYARQITLEVSRPRIVLSGGGGGDASPLTTLLIISFPQNFPSTHLLPTFTVRSLYEATASSAGTDTATQEAQHSMLMSLEAELAEVAASALHGTHKFASSLSTSTSTSIIDSGSSSGFMLNVARCFWNRVQQVWCEVQAGRRRNDDLPKDTTGTEDADGHDIRRHSISKTDSSETEMLDNVHVASGSAGMDRERVIDARAYRVCCPVSSGGIFSCTGSLSLFGGSVLQLGMVTGDTNCAGGGGRIGNGDGNVDTTAPPDDSKGQAGANDASVGDGSGGDIVLDGNKESKYVKKHKKKSAIRTRTPHQFSFFPAASTSSALESGLPGGQGQGQGQGRGHAVLSSSASSGVHPKTYADVLLQQREIKAASSRRNYRRTEGGGAMARVREGGEGMTGARMSQARRGEGAGGDSGLRAGPYLAHCFGHGGGALDTDDSNSDSLSCDDATSDDVEEEQDEEDEEEEEEEVEGEVPTTTSHNFFNTSLDELGAKLDRTQEEGGNTHDSQGSHDSDDAYGYDYNDEEGDEEDEDDGDDDDEEDESKGGRGERRGKSSRQRGGGGGNSRLSMQQLLLQQSFTSAQPASITLHLHICGVKRFNLAREYTFRTFLAHPPAPPSQHRDDPSWAAGLGGGSPLSRNKHHSTSDSDVHLTKHFPGAGAAATAAGNGSGNGSGLVSAGTGQVDSRGSPSNLGKRVASMNNISAAVVFESPPMKSQSQSQSQSHTPPRDWRQQRARDAALRGIDPGTVTGGQQQYPWQQDGESDEAAVSVSVLSSGAAFFEEQKQGDRLTSQQQQQQHGGVEEGKLDPRSRTGSVSVAESVSVDAHDVSEACRANSDLARRVEDVQLAHVWHLLSVSMSIMAITKYVLVPAPSAESSTLLTPRHSTHSHPQFHLQPQSSNALESCRVRVSCGVSKSWTEHSLGRPLLQRVFTHLRCTGDLQTLAALICTAGGPRVLALMLGDASLLTTSSLDSILRRSVHAAQGRAGHCRVACLCDVM